MLLSGKTITNEEEALAVMEILHKKGVSTVILSRWVKANVKEVPELINASSVPCSALSSEAVITWWGWPAATRPTPN